MKPGIASNATAVLLAAVVSAAGPGSAHAAGGGPAAQDFDSPLLFVHPLVNYALHPEWLAAWEQVRISRHAVLATFGSVSTDELGVDAAWTLNHELAAGLWFRNDLLWRQTRHLDFERAELLLGLEKRLYGPLGAVVLCQPAHAKEDLDLQVGAIVASRDRRRYAQVVYVMDDLVFDKKNDAGARTLQPPHGLAWLARGERGDWSAYTEGRWLQRFERQYPDTARTPDLAAHDRQSGDLVMRLRRAPASGVHLEFSFACAKFLESHAYRDPARNDHYEGWIAQGGARSVLPLSSRWRLRAELHRLHRHAEARGVRVFDYRRTETIPALFGAWQWDRNEVELGYMGTIHAWHYEGEAETAGYADKVEIALRCGLEGGSALQVSLSHEVSIERFGGANVQLLTLF